MAKLDKKMIDANDINKAREIKSMGWSRDLEDETLVHEFTNFANGTSVVRTTRIYESYNSCKYSRENIGKTK